MVFLLGLLTAIIILPSSANDDNFVWDSEMYGGHSREFLQFNDPKDWNSLTADQGTALHLRRKRDAIYRQLPPDDDIKHFIHSHKPAAIALLADVKRISQKEWVSTTMRIKSFPSLREKIILKRYTLERIRDVIGIRLIFQTVSDVLLGKELLTNATNSIFTVKEIRCYGFCNETEKFNKEGYRRIHLLVRISSYDKWAEIQLGTPYTNMWSDWSHDFLYKGLFSKSSASELYNYALGMADYFFKLDDNRNVMPPCPDRLKSTDAREVLDPAVYNFLGQPDNLCFHWPDIFLTEFESNRGHRKPTTLFSTIFLTVVLLMFLH